MATPHTEAPLLSVRDLHTHFISDEGIVRAVDGVSFDVRPGKTLGIVGESGCGKSVTTRSILGLVRRPGKLVGGQIIFRPSTPDGMVREIDLTRLDPQGREMRTIRGRQIGLVFQEPMSSFSPVHTIGDQIGEKLRQHQDLSRRGARQKVIELLRQVGIPRAEGRVDEFPHQLSGGLRQRAMIAMALACDPTLLIADEPTTALDVTTQAQIMELLGRLQRERGMAIMLITHNLGLVAEMADDVAVMYLGKVVEEGPVDEIFNAPKHPYTQALLRSMPSIESPRRVKLPTITGSIPHPYNRPQGCRFHPRCPQVIKGVCDRFAPEPIAASASQVVSCFLYGGRPGDAR